MAYTHDETLPSALRVAFPTGATDITDFKAGMRDIFNTGLSNNALPTPPATLANYDSQIPTPGPGVVPAPLRWRGDRIDLRGCPHRDAAPTTDVNNLSKIIVFAGAPAADNNFAGLQLVMTPVSATSVIELVAQVLVFVSASDDWTSNANMVGQIRCMNTTDSAVVGRTFGFPVIIGKTSGGCFYSAHLRTRVTGITGAHTFDLQGGVLSATQSLTVRIRGDIQTSEVYYLESV